MPAAEVGQQGHSRRRGASQITGGNIDQNQILCVDIGRCIVFGSIVRSDYYLLPLISNTGTVMLCIATVCLAMYYLYQVGTITGDDSK